MRGKHAMPSKKLYRITVGTLVIAVVISGSLLISSIVQSRREHSVLMHLAEQKALAERIMTDRDPSPPQAVAKPFAEHTPEAEPIVPEPQLPPQQSPSPVWIDPYDQNKDMIGWIQIEGSAVDYPVMFTGDDFYLNHGFDKKRTKSGLPYVDGQCTVNPLGTNTLIHGHNMKNGTMFSELLAYEDQSYFEAHSLIQFELYHQVYSYEIIAVIQSRVYGEDEPGFLHYQFFNAKTQDDFDAYLSEIKRLALYDTGVNATYGDQFITLSTCSYHTENGRLLVVARKLVP